MPVGGSVQVAGVERLDAEKSYVGRVFDYDGIPALVVSEDLGQDPLSNELVSKSDFMLLFPKVRKNGGFAFSAEESDFLVRCALKDSVVEMKANKVFFWSLKTTYEEWERGHPPELLLRYGVSSAKPIKAGELLKKVTLGGKAQRRYKLSPIKPSSRKSKQQQRAPLVHAKRSPKRPRFPITSPPRRAIRIDNFVSAAAAAPTRASPSSRPVFVAPIQRQRSNDGFPNVGNSCFASSIVQLLARTTNFISDGLSSHKPEGGCELRNALITASSELYDSSKTPSIFPIIKLVEGFGNFRQHDAHEFLVSMLSRLEKKFKTLVEDFLSSKIRVELVCDACGEIKSKSEEFLVHSVEIYGNSAIDSLNAYFKSETVECNCDECDSRTAQMRYVLVRAPKFLLVHFKLFNALGHKIQTSFELDDRLDLVQVVAVDFRSAVGGGDSASSATAVALETSSTPVKTVETVTPTTSRPTQIPSTKYVLKGAVTHVGKIPSHGHYTATIKTDDDRFKTYDDDRVYENVSKPRQAYVACYELM